MLHKPQSIGSHASCVRLVRTLLKRKCTYNTASASVLRHSKSETLSGLKTQQLLKQSCFLLLVQHIISFTKAGLKSRKSMRLMTVFISDSNLQLI